MRYTIDFTAGDTTCALQPGKFCEWMTISKGQSYHCYLFGMIELRDEHGVNSGPGWLQRCPECMKRAKVKT